MNLILIVLLNFFAPTEIVIPNTIGDVVNLGGKLATYKVLDRYKDSILLFPLLENDKTANSVAVHRDLLDFSIYYNSPYTISSTDENGISLGVDTITNQYGDIAILPKRRISDKDNIFLNIADTICFLVSPKGRKARFPVNSVFGVVDNRVHVLDYSYSGSAADLCFTYSRRIKSYDQLKGVIEKMISYREMNFDPKKNPTLTEAYEDFVDYFEIDYSSYKNLESIGTNLVFVSKTFNRIKGRKLEKRLIGFYELDEFAHSKFPQYIRFRHIENMPINNTREFKRAINLVINKKRKNNSDYRMINRFILNYLENKEDDSTIRELVNKLLSNSNLDEILFEDDIRSIRNWLEKNNACNN